MTAPNDTGIAVVGLACRYPDAVDARELWELVLSQRRAFRRVPPERLRLADYEPRADGDPDSTYLKQAALLEDYTFDRARFRVVGSTYRAADLAHWLALDVAARALDDAGFSDGSGLPRETTGVLLGNSLTGEFSRAATLRLRWPYVRRVLDAVLRDENRSRSERAQWLARAEALYKAPFEAPGEETLAGGLANTIAGRICNHFDLGGGGFTVDGACSSSLLAIAQACSALVAGDADVMLAGGVDLSLDPFELVGFARTGALAKEEMRVYDERSAGFWPGEGCGVVVLMRERDAIERGVEGYAVIRGWGVSSDGAGGLTRPESAGQRRAIDRAYRRAGFGIASVGYFEGHGTGTAVGDAVELTTLGDARRADDAGAPRAAIGSIKANFGHTKAAAGVAGFIKAALAVKHEVLPPTTGFEAPHPALAETSLRLLDDGEPWRTGPRRAAVSSMGFGGINAHVVLEEPARDAATKPSAGSGDDLDSAARSLARSAQDCELFLLSAADDEALLRRIDELLEWAGRLSRAETADLSAALARDLDPRAPRRAAVVAATPDHLEARLRRLREWVGSGTRQRADATAGLFLGAGGGRLAFLFPGQGSPAHPGGGALRRRFPEANHIYENLRLPADGEPVATTVAQPAIIAASLAASRVLQRAGVAAVGACGHSLGELTALAWGGAVEDAPVLELARERGRLMAEHAAEVPGAMASISALPDEIEERIAGTDCVIAGFNGPRSTVISGPKEAVVAVAERARREGRAVVRLKVSHAFHSPLVAAAAKPLAGFLRTLHFSAPRRRVHSTITGTALLPTDDVRELLTRQVTAPVRFAEAVREMARDVDAIIEVGPGGNLTTLATEIVDVPVIATDAGGGSLRGLLTALGAAYALSEAPALGALLADRFTRPFEPERRLRFLANPCEEAPLSGTPLPEVPATTVAVADDTVVDSSDLPAGSDSDGDPFAVLRDLVAERTELPAETIEEQHRFLDDLHLNSIAVGLLVAEAARRLDVAAPASPHDYANASLEEVAAVLAAAQEAPRSDRRERWPDGVADWARCFRIVEEGVPEGAAHVAARTDESGDDDPGSWEAVGSAADDTPRALRRRLEADVGGRGTVFLHGDQGATVPSLLAALKRHRQNGDRFVLVHHGGTGHDAAALVRTFHLENPRTATTIIELPASSPIDPEAVASETIATSRFREVRVDDDGGRRRPVLVPISLPETEVEATPLGTDDVILATGGAKGITAECVLDLARRSGARVLLLGRSTPEEDAVLAAQLRRFDAIDFRYCAVDVTDGEAVRAAIAGAQDELGPVTAIVHGAGVNRPCLLKDLDRDALAATWSPKVEGLRHVLAAIDTGSLRLLVTFGSIIGRAGLAGQGDYAVANAALTRVTEEFARDHERCRCLALEWSVWAGTGMGDRLGTIEALRSEGITAIPLDAGVATFAQLLADDVRGTVVVTGRTGDLATLSHRESPLPLLRFLQNPRVHVPGVELVVDCDLSSATDPYLAEHRLQGESVLPAVVAMEAMVQAATALAGESRPPILEDVEFARPVTVPREHERRIRVAALAAADGASISVVVRSDESDFLIDHAAARVVFRGARSPHDTEAESERRPEDGVTSCLDPEHDLYGDLLFHTGRFRKLRRYHSLSAHECHAELSADDDVEPFQAFLPRALLLGDFAQRDAVIHCIQVCVPQATLLPIAIERWEPHAIGNRGGCRVAARQRRRDGDRFVYDVAVRDEHGNLRERWIGLVLQVLPGSHRDGPWVDDLLGPYLERALEEVFEGPAPRVSAERNGGEDRRARSDRVLERVLGDPGLVERRADGKPMVTDGRHVSASHAGELVVATAARSPIGCDVEPVVTRSEDDWRDLLGASGYELAARIARETNEEFDRAATRTWTVRESLVKSGAPVDSPLSFDRDHGNGWILIRAGKRVAASVITHVRDERQPLAFAVLVERGDGV